MAQPMPGREREYRYARQISNWQAGVPKIRKKHIRLSMILYKTITLLCQARAAQERATQAWEGERKLERLFVSTHFSR
jgi:hypothetical protein